MENQKRAIALLSGGLDSALSAQIVKMQGVEVIGLHLVSPFGCVTQVEKVAAHLGIRLIKRDKGEAYLELVENPRFGYGKNMNPCIDCRIYMFDLASRVMKEEQAHFVVTGEVLGQRPMSQMRNSLATIDSHSGLKGLCLRPLSAARLAPTIPEERGWVRREELFGISGRGRREQLKLAQDLAISGYAAPGGGCLLTESAFSKRLLDFFRLDKTTGEIRHSRSQMLRLGRHFRWSDDLRLIVGRDERENAELDRMWQRADAHFFRPKTFMGPDAVAFGEVGHDDARRIGSILARYGNVDGAQEVSLRTPATLGAREELVPIDGRIPEGDLERWRI